MYDINLFIFGIFATALIVAGFIFTMLEFKRMGEHPDEYTGKDRDEK